MKLTVYSRWEESKDSAFLAVLENNPNAKVIDFRWVMENSLFELKGKLVVARCGVLTWMGNH